MSLFARKTTTAIVAGKEVQFYPLSMGNLYRLKTMLQPLAVLIAGLFQRGQQDNNSMVEKIKEKDGREVETAHISATDVSLARFRQDRREKTISDLISALMSDDNKLMVGRIITDSIRGQFANKLTDPDVLTFMDELDVPTMGELVHGFMKANAGVLGPLGPALLNLLRAKMRSQEVQEESASPESVVPDAAPALRLTK